MNTIHSKFSFKQLVTILVASLMILMENIDTNILNVAIPAIATDLNAPPLQLKLAITSYLISLAIFIPISGWISDQFGTRKVLLWAIFAFGLFSLFCGFAHSLFELVIFRFLQGIAGAFMAPVGRLLMLKAFDKSDRVKVYVLMSLPVVLGPLLAPFLGGVLVSLFNWRYIFYVNVPFALLALLGTYVYVENYVQKTDKFNWWSFIWLGLFLSIFSYWLDTAFDPKPAATKSLILVFAIISLLAYLKVEFSSDNKIINYKLFSIRTFKICFYSSIITRASFGGRGFALVLFLQYTLQMPPIIASYLLSSMAVGLFLGRIFVKRVLDYLGFKLMLTISNIGAAISLLLFGFIRTIDAFSICVLILNGLFTTVGFMLLNILCYADIEEADYASATGIVSTTQQLSFSLGVVIAASALHIFNSLFGEFTFSAFNAAFIAISILGLFSQVYLSKLKNSDGDDLIDHHHLGN